MCVGYKGQKKEGRKEVFLVVSPGDFNAIPRERRAKDSSLGAFICINDERVFRMAAAWIQ